MSTESQIEHLKDDVRYAMGYLEDIHKLIHEAEKHYRRRIEKFIEEEKDGSATKGED